MTQYTFSVEQHERVLLNNVATSTVNSMERAIFSYVASALIGGISMLEVVASRVVAYSTTNAERERIIAGSAHP